VPVLRFCLRCPDSGTLITLYIEVIVDMEIWGRTCLADLTFLNLICGQAHPARSQRCLFCWFSTVAVLSLTSRRLDEPGCQPTGQPEGHSIVAGNMELMHEILAGRTRQGGTAGHAQCWPNRTGPLTKSTQRLTKKPGLAGRASFATGVPTGIRTPVASVKGKCPRPLDDGDGWAGNYIYLYKLKLVEPAGIEPATSCMPCRRSPS
jgi:hypothetical protein